MRDIEGKAAREAASECGQRASFKLYVLPSYFRSVLLSTFVPLSSRACAGKHAKQANIKVKNTKPSVPETPDERLIGVIMN